MPRPKGRIERKRTVEEKLEIIESYLTVGSSETERIYQIDHHQFLRWHRYYLEEGVQGLEKERRGRSKRIDGVNKGRPPKIDKKVEEDLIAENQRLRMENEYLKKLEALIQAEEKKRRKSKLR